MAQQYDQADRGLLARNKRRRPEQRPEVTGELDVEGVKYFLNAWVRDGWYGKFFQCRDQMQGRSGAPGRGSGVYAVRASARE
jgi:hypothetical protein